MLLCRDGRQTGPDKAMFKVFVVSNDRGACGSCIAQTTGAGDRCVVKVVACFIDSLGPKQAITRTDIELAIQNLSGAVAQGARRQPVVRHQEHAVLKELGAQRRRTDLRGG